MKQYRFIDRFSFLTFYIVMVILSSSVNVFSQGGFFNRYDFDNASMIFGNIQISNDTLIIHGMVINPEPPHQQGLIFMKLDTFGQVLHQYVNYNQNDKSRAFASNNDQSLLKIRDGSGYISMGGYLREDTGVILKLNNNGETVWERTINDPSSYLLHLRWVIELDDGFLISGLKYIRDDGNDALIIKIDKNGNEKWRKTFGDPEIWEVFSTLIEINENETILAGHRSSSLFIPFENQWIASRSIAIDSMGNLLWEKEGEKRHDKGGMGNVFIDQKGNYNYLSLNYLIGDTLNQEIYTQPKFMIRDTGFSIIFEKTYGEPGYLKGFIDMIPMSDGGWTVVGRNQEDNDPITGEKYHWAAWILRLDENADTMWTHQLLVFPELRDTLGSEQYFHSVAELSSGSVVASGNYEDYWFTPGQGPRFSGIIVKIDKNGCLDTLLCPPMSSIVTAEEFGEELLVYPNPATEQVNFSFDENFQKEKNKELIISDLTGNVIFRTSIFNRQKDITWQPEELPAGIYFYQLTSNETLLKSGKILWMP